MARAPVYIVLKAFALAPRLTVSLSNLATDTSAKFLWGGMGYITSLFTPLLIRLGIVVVTFIKLDVFRTGPEVRADAPNSAMGPGCAPTAETFDIAIITITAHSMNIVIGINFVDRGLRMGQGTAVGQLELPAALEPATSPILTPTPTPTPTSRRRTRPRGSTPPGRTSCGRSARELARRRGSGTGEARVQKPRRRLGMVVNLNWVIVIGITRYMMSDGMAAASNMDYGNMRRSITEATALIDRAPVITRIIPHCEALAINQSSNGNVIRVSKVAVSCSRC